MKINNTINKIRLGASIAVTVMLVSSASYGEDIWSRGSDYFIRLESQDTLRNQTPPRNNHPHTLSKDSIRHALSLLYYAPASDDEATPLFAEHTLDLLSVALHNGLREASPTQDVTFLIETWHELFLGLSEALVVGGRAFFVGDSLQLIIGTLRSPNRRSLSEAEGQVVNKDTRLHPYFIGYRDKRIRHKGVVSAEANSGIYTASANRRDWLVFTPDALGRGEEGGGKAEKTSAKMPSIDDMELKPSVRKRLEALKKLRDDGLISDDDFQQKKRDILKDL